jgi:signal transduction histidine kinase
VKLVRLLVWAGGTALCATLLVGALRGGWPRPETAKIMYSAEFVGLTLGAIVWQLRPESRTGIFLTAWPITSMLSDLAWVFSGSALAVTIGLASGALGAPVFAQLVLSYPTGRLSRRADRILVSLVWAYAIFVGLMAALFFDPRPGWETTFLWYQPHALPFTHLGWYDSTRLDPLYDWLIVALVPAFLVLLVRKLVRMSPGGRRIVLPLALASTFAVVEFTVQVVFFDGPVNTWSQSNRGWFWIVTLASLAIPVSLAAGLLWGRRARAVVADLVVELEHAPPGSVRDALARALGDPTLELALWLPDRGSYADGHGRPLALPASGSDRAVTVLGTADAPVAALIHDPVLLERPALLKSAGAAALLALENERLQAELRAQLAELRASRARIVTAGDEERRRLERNLHDGAQQRLLSLGLALQLVRGELGPEANGAVTLLGEAEEELGAALAELRELAQGIHPVVLTEHGLGPALSTLAARAPLPVDVEALPGERLPAPVEAAAYFVVSEALANVVKHARASSVRLSAVCRDGSLVVEVTDDGIGGAEAKEGSGLAGLSDRVHALDGDVTVESTPGCGTRVRAELPYALQPVEG